MTEFQTKPVSTIPSPPSQQQQQQQPDIIDSSTQVLPLDQLIEGLSNIAYDFLAHWRDTETDILLFLKGSTLKFYLSCLLLSLIFLLSIGFYRKLKIC